MMPKLDIKPYILPWVYATKKIVPTCIVLHWWGEPINDQGVTHLAGLLENRQLSVQYAVLANGEIYKLAPSPDTFCRHAKCANESAIGIEIEGYNEVDLDANELQFSAVVRLVKELQTRFMIPVDFRAELADTNARFFGVTSHKQVDTYCENGTGKNDVHDKYTERIRIALQSAT